MRDGRLAYTLSYLLVFRLLIDDPVDLIFHGDSLLYYYCEVLGGPIVSSLGGGAEGPTCPLDPGVYWGFHKGIDTGTGCYYGVENPKEYL